MFKYFRPKTAEVIVYSGVINIGGSRIDSPVSPEVEAILLSQKDKLDAAIADMRTRLNAVAPHANLQVMRWNVKLTYYGNSWFMYKYTMFINPILEN